HFLDEKNIRLFTSHKVYTETEMRSRYEIALENYVKTIRIEANTMIDMIRKEILPAVTAYAKDTAAAALAKKQLIADIDTAYEEGLVKKLSELTASIQRDTLALADTVKRAEGIRDNTERAIHAKDRVLPLMRTLRAACDEAESLTAETYWPYPTYAALLFGVE
nr:glutamine synthetase type III [Clostridiales bacterium]